MKLPFQSLSVLLVSVCACGGGGSSAPGTVTGTIHGQPFAVKDAISASVTFTDTTTGTTSSQAAIFLTSTANACADFTNNIQRKSEKAFVVGVATITGSTVAAPTATGAYTVFNPNGGGAPPAMAALVNAVATDATCMSDTANSATGTSGTVTLTTINNGVFDGKFDITLDSGDHVTGSFSPEGCPALQQALNSTMTPTCM